jgi:hypothetical protein
VTHSGGWLALLTGMGIGFEACGIQKPAPPTSIAAIYPITDLNDPFWHTKQHPVSYMPRVIKEEELTEFLDPSKPISDATPLDHPRSMFYHYMIQECVPFRYWRAWLTLCCQSYPGEPPS